MSEEWIKKLTEELRHVDGHVAEEIHKRDSRNHRISTQAPPFWRTFVQCLKQYFDEVEADLKGTHLEAVQSFDADERKLRLVLSRQRLPFLNFQISPNFGTPFTFHATVMKQNPEMPTTGAPSHQMPFRFDENEHGHIYMVIDGTDLHDPKDAARHLIEKLFKVEKVA